MGRLNNILMEAGGIGRNEDGSITRLGFSEDYFQALELIKKHMESLGMKTEVDPVGNLHGILPGKDPSLKSIVLGSHLDTVIKGGVFDGMLGVAGAVECVYRLKEQDIILDHTLEIWGFNMEESSILGGTFGSRAITGMLDPDQPGYAEKLATFDRTPDDVRAAKKDISKYDCYLEYHIEQGDKLDSADIDVGVVNGIVSVIRYQVTANGVSNHAGTTMMPNRKDALVGMSKLIVAADARARELDDTLVFTVGKMSVAPGQENVIPNEVVATFEMRHMDKSVTDQFFADIQAAAKEIPNCTFTFKNTVAKYSTPCDPKLVRIIDQVCSELNISHMIMPSGAGHDANPMAHEGVPIGMIFVPSVNGISHHGKEWTEPHHVDLGAEVLFKTVLTLDKTDRK
ncbi:MULTISPECIES: Zn-dependent hydrolase [Eubacteriales]|uniref:Zn-dependent hydrolase n=1 Tax=Eubacteriales TaxID=186802 RepID=UPI000820B447|nr:Zn-dependent hydrolase [Muriventricola aceti]MCU6704118.1 Zn-dependent hydrolase [Muriventricola aceti]SCJ69432.1 N-carbamoyl-L-amino acid hydrolase [uncultured Flavonifractor sp.]